MDVKSKAFRTMVHSRMLRFYAVSIKCGERDFLKFLKNSVFPGISLDRPYENNKRDWEVDCFIKLHPVGCLAGFARVSRYIGKEAFKKQVDDAVREVDDIGSMAIQGGMFR